MAADVLTMQVGRACVAMKLSYFSWNIPVSAPGPLFTKRADVFYQDLVKSLSREILV